MSALLRRAWPLILLGAIALLIALWSTQTVFPSLSWNRDEPVYLWQAEALRDGHLTPPTGGAPASFRPWLTGIDGEAFFAQYTLGWPVVIVAADVVTGAPELAIALGAILTVLGTYAFTRALLGDRSVALTAAAVMTASPILMIQGGVYLGYLFTLGLGLLFAASLLTGVRDRTRSGTAVAGALLGWIFMTRPFDAVLWGIAVVGYVAFDRRRELRSLGSNLGWVALGFAPFFAATLAYNAYITGSATQFPITATDPLDTFGFGNRRIMPGFPPTEYTLVSALKATLKNGFYVGIFLFGAYAGLVVAAIGLWRMRRRQTSLLLLAIIAVFPVGYFFFFGNSISSLTSQLSGPIYFMPLYAPLCILIATVIVAGWRYRPAAGVGLVTALVIVTAPFAVNRVVVNHDISEAQTPWVRSSAVMDKDALVFVADTNGYLLFLNPFSSNSAELDNRPLFAVDAGPADLRLIDQMPDRTPYRQEASLPVDELGPRAHTHTPTVTVEPLQVERGDAIDFRVRVTNTSGAAAVVAFLKIGDQVQRVVLSQDSRTGEVLEARFRRVVPGGAAEGRPLPRPAGTIVVGAGFGADEKVAGRRPTVMQMFPYRIVDHEMEVLLPATARRVRIFEGHEVIQQVRTLPELAVRPRVS